VKFYKFIVYLVYIVTTFYFTIIGTDREHSPKNEEIPGWNYTQTHRNLIYFSVITDDSRGAIITTCSHTFTLFWSRKAFVIAEIYQVSVCLYVLSTGDLFIFPYLFLFIVLSVLRYFPFHVITICFT
jgi:hypothetical protein